MTGLPETAQDVRSARARLSAPPSPEARAVADDLAFDAVVQACARVTDYLWQTYEAARARDARMAAIRLRQAVLTLRAACEVVGMLSEGAS